ncbi:hypothetical protein [Enterobacter kobei]|uniref:hypothetical protein n=1 Tax=Enterobacter kobei TaxID=208224 RepID=UPI0009946228|nr:hypothetical protein [Enterobacter kobei]OOV75096.1 hypothetical protein B1742_08725 [Enterobacter kobei]HDT6027816.1 hypothetical protein [Enterobacter cloacae subsp. cloacae]HDT6093951.1 hypothetical protein [Enterobacter cloacae subsp. cloacae]
MLERETIMAALIAQARIEGRALNADDLLTLRTRITTALKAKERHRQRMNAAPYQWNKPKPPRR